MPNLRGARPRECHRSKKKRAPEDARCQTTELRVQEKLNLERENRSAGNAVHFDREARVNIEGDRHAPLILNVEVLTMVAVMVAAPQDEGRLAAVLNDSANEERAVLGA